MTTPENPPAFPRPAIITRQQADEIQRTAKHHLVICEDNFALHAAMKDGIIYVLHEERLAERQKRKEARHEP